MRHFGFCVAVIPVSAAVYLCLPLPLGATAIVQYDPN